MQTFRPTDILVPKVEDMSAWSVVACDQFTSDPEYWQRVYERVGDKPSSLRMILPEAELGVKDPEIESKIINATMEKYLNEGVFDEYRDSYIYLERILSNGTVRRGLIGALDLEGYDWSADSTSPIRSTEFTVEDRLPPRVKVREEAVLEMPHIMVFFDDPGNTVFSAVNKGKEVYDFELMENGGHVRGWIVSDNACIDNAISSLFDEQKLREKYGATENPVIFAMGDGNHSLAAAKVYWEKVKASISPEEWDSCPARFVLAELVNIHDEAITFEPIHKVIFETKPEEFFAMAEDFFKNNIGDGKLIELISGNDKKVLNIADMTIGELIGACEDLCKSYSEKFGGKIDYIHGDDECIEMSSREGCCGILLPKMEKSELFTSVMKSGPFPKKSFSIGHGPDKRYYLECRKIK